MSSHFRPVPVAAMRLARRTRCQRCFLLIAIALSIQGCAPAPRPLVGPDAADPNVRVPTTVYRSAIGDFKTARPSEPAPWRERDGGNTPQPKKDGP
jgi:hypothetical protein